MSEPMLPLPTAPYVVIGLVATAVSADALLRATADALAAMGARPLPPDPRPNTLAFETPEAGVVLVSARVDERDPRFAAVEISVSGELIGAPAWIPLSPEEESELQRTQDFVGHAFAVICGRLEPLYAGVGIEWTPPLPSALSDACLPCDVYRSACLDASDPRLAADLDMLYAAMGRPFLGGTLIAAGGLLDADAESPAEPLASGRAAARRLAHALASMVSTK